MTQEALKMALQVLEDCVNSYGMKYERPAFVKAITAIKEALAQPAQTPVAKYSDIVSDGGLDPRNKFNIPPQRTEQEPVAWRTFDGEGGYDYRSYEDNESYADDWNKRNPNHAGWVDKLYTHSQREKNT